MRRRAQQDGRLLRGNGNPATVVRFSDRGTVTRILNIAPAWLAALRREPDATNGDARSTQSKAPGDLCRALEELAKEKALVLVFEDLHWANDSTLELISALARRKAPTKLMVMGTYSSHCSSAEQPLKALKQDLVMHRQCTELALAPLAKTAVRQLLSKELGQEALPSGLDILPALGRKSSICACAFAAPYCRSLHCARRRKRSGDWKQVAQFPEMEAGVPQELVQLIDPEIERLSAPEQRILEAASLMPVVFPAWAVAAVLQQDPTETEEACDRLARRLCFVHRAGHDELPTAPVQISMCLPTDSIAKFYTRSRPRHAAPKDISGLQSAWANYSRVARKRSARDGHAL